MKLFTKNREILGSLLMVLATIVAMLLANSTLSDWYFSFIEQPISIGSLTESLQGWVKDTLMALFFLMISLELKREFITGHLSDRRQIALPLFAAVGGMIAPACLYLAINWQHPEYWRGFAIPCATDIPFSLCLFGLAARCAPPSVKVFLLTLAVFDDLGAILIIAFFYSKTLAWPPILFVLLTCALLLFLHHRRVSYMLPYFLLGAVLWICLHQAGIHTTMAGVLLGLFIPFRGKVASQFPLKELMHKLDPWVQFAILPFFAFTASGVCFAKVSTADLLNTMVLGISLGLFLGKQLGIFMISWLAVKYEIAAMPPQSSWRHIYGTSLIAGIGFTMSLFIGQLAFKDPHSSELVKIGVLSGSLASAICATLALRNKKKTLHKEP